MSDNKQVTWNLTPEVVSSCLLFATLCEEVKKKTGKEDRCILIDWLLRQKFFFAVVVVVVVLYLLFSVTRISRERERERDEKATSKVFPK